MTLPFIVYLLLLCIPLNKARDPETLIVHALIRNGTTPVDLVNAICRWMLLPSEMSMNQLVQCRDLAERCLWSGRCKRIISEKIAKGDQNGTTSITFTPCSSVYAIMIQNHANEYSKLSIRRWIECIERNKKLRISAIFRDPSSRHFKVVQRERRILIAGPRLELLVRDESVMMHSLCTGRFSFSEYLEYTVENVTFSWDCSELAVTDIVQQNRFKPFYV